MSISPIPDIVKTIGQVPHEFAQHFSKMLHSLLTSFVSLAEKNLNRMRQDQMQQNAPTSASEKQFKKVPFIPDSPQKNENIVPDYDPEFDKNKHRVKGPGG